MTAVFLLIVAVLGVIALRKVMIVRRKIATGYRDETNFYRGYIHPKGEGNIADRKELSARIKVKYPHLNRQQCMEKAIRVQELMREKSEEMRRA